MSWWPPVLSTLFESLTGSPYEAWLAQLEQQVLSVQAAVLDVQSPPLTRTAALDALRALRTSSSALKAHVEGPVLTPTPPEQQRARELLGQGAGRLLVALERALDELTEACVLAALAQLLLRPEWGPAAWAPLLTRALHALLARLGPPTPPSVPLPPSRLDWLRAAAALLSRLLLTPERAALLRALPLPPTAPLDPAHYALPTLPPLPAPRPLTHPTPPAFPPLEPQGELPPGLGAALSVAGAPSLLAWLLGQAAVAQAGAESPLYAWLLHSTLHALRPVPVGRWGRPLLDAAGLLVQADGRVANLFLRHALTRTLAFDLEGVAEALGAAQGWLQDAPALDEQLDWEFLQEVGERILLGDHHVLVARLLLLLFALAPRLLSDARRGLLFDWLLKRHFFTLFLHWDEGVRQFFHQFLLFRLTRLSWLSLGRAEAAHAPALAPLLPPSADLQHELMLDYAAFGKALASIKLVEEAARGKLEVLPVDAPRRVYVPRALADYHWLLQRHAHTPSREWRLQPLLLLDPQRRGPVRPRE